MKMNIKTVNKSMLFVFHTVTPPTLKNQLHKHKLKKISKVVEQVGNYQYSNKLCTFNMTRQTFQNVCGHALFDKFVFYKTNGRPSQRCSDLKSLHGN